ncbi:MAG: RloB domain-containing protein [Chloroflexi bacterium AL-W]|nr:RloB domain-containing protein [Chloroflexi bacterium AL-N1]NOK64785.1 RloB domain-containing protein [Chloroflexi bacterium AL-N10]NOK76555.1 RloB domain-containing protein [Chloroflexi bacterium AL-N5]NOK80215.1 RloB domain-containing protein [Chloroflexi bacterium AL-W]NOK86728.1 RloB domain-containing protein [Chloroflexi bacterium AL-N15]
MSKRSGRGERVWGRRKRGVGTREVRQRFLIVCEGEQTEPHYFRAFQVPGLVIKIYPVNERTVGLIKEADRLNAEDDYDQVWCVFDRDDFPADHIHQAINLAKRYEFGVAFSNQAFELWYHLHFAYHNTTITRRDYCDQLSRRFGQKYVKNSMKMYDELLPHQETAIRNAERLLNSYTPRQPTHDDPSTTMSLLRS